MFAEISGSESVFPFRRASYILRMEKTPKRPIILGIRGIPSIRVAEPKIYLSIPVVGLMPMHDNQRPNAIERKFLAMPCPAMPMTVLMQRNESMKYYGGPNRMSKEARIGSNKSRTKALLITPK